MSCSKIEQLLSGHRKRNTKKGRFEGGFLGGRYKHIGQGLKMAGRGVSVRVVGKGGFCFGVNVLPAILRQVVFPFRWQKKSPRLKGGRAYISKIG